MELKVSDYIICIVLAALTGVFAASAIYVSVDHYLQRKHQVELMQISFEQSLKAQAMRPKGKR